MVMVRKMAWRKNNLREIKHTFERYLAIVAIITLGVGFFAGLKTTKSSMVKTLNTYVSDCKMYDFRLISSLGLTKDDVEYFDKQDGMSAEGAITIDFIAETEKEKDIVLKAHSITNKINLLKVKKGRMAEAGNECLLDSRYFTEDMIGTEILVSSSNDEDTMDSLAYKEYKVVGLTDSVNYLNYDRGKTDLAGGTVTGFVYIPEEGFSTEYYTEILVRYDGNYEVYSKEYEDFISEKEDILEEALEKRGQLRYEDIVEDAKQEVLDAEKEYNDAWDEYVNKKAETEEKLNKALKELTDAEAEIKDKEKQLKDAEEKLKQGEKEYEKSLLEYKNGLKEYESKKEETMSTINSGREELKQNRLKVVSAMTQIEESGVIDKYSELTENIKLLEASLAQIPDTESEEYLTLSAQLNQAKSFATEIEATGVLSQYEELKENLEKINEGERNLDEALKKANHEFEATETKLKKAKNKLDMAKKEIDKNKTDIEKGWEALNEGKAEYKEGLKEYNENKKEAEESFAEAEEKLNEAKKEIDEGWDKINDIPTARVYVLNRDQNIGYASFDNDSSIVEGIARILPIFFFLVAALVCSTTMTRMVDEQRTLIGTLKALGYSDGAIIGKYSFYSGSAAIIGCGIGYFLGTKYFPLAIWKAYNIIYRFADLKYVFDIKLALISLIVSLICSVGVTFSSCKAELLQMPAQLIRPKAPKAGKRVFLEYIPFIWKRISFLRKVSIRNILRYKRRFFMTIFGIAGCTALVVAAMGISNSIKNIVNDQFDEIMTYDYSISFTEAQSPEEQEKFKSEFSDELTECVFVVADETEAVQDNTTKKVKIVATDDPDITKVIGLHYKGKDVSYPAYGKVAVSDKLAEDFGLKPGDRIRIKINETEMTEAEIESVFENYLYNYLLMTGKTYEALFNKKADYDSAYAATDNEDIYAVSASLSKDENVVNVSVLNDMRTMVDNMMKSMDYIIWLVILCAGALGFVVIYNLNNINITERSREIATIKVLGFYSNETKQYVYRETVILTIIGSLAGLGLGKLLHRFIMDQIDVEAVSFKVQIFGISYLIALAVTYAITFLVNLMLTKKIEKINMTESLKSVE